MIFTPMAGGLGDILTYYLEGELGYFRALRSAGVRTKAVVWSVSDQAADLFQGEFERIPLLSEFTVRPFAAVAGMTTGFRNYAQNLESDCRLMTDAERAATPWEQPEFYLSPMEGAIACDLASKPYVVVHPFAGQPDRNLTRGKDDLARRIIETAASDTRVVVLGGDSTRANGSVTSALFENFASEYPNVISLVNGASVRLQAHVASRAQKFIGAVSCYNCVAHHFRIPSLVFGSTGNRYAMQTGAGSIFAKMRAANTQIHYLDQRPDAARLVREFMSC